MGYLLYLMSCGNGKGVIGYGLVCVDRLAVFVGWNVGVGNGAALDRGVVSSWAMMCVPGGGTTLIRGVSGRGSSACCGTNISAF